MSATMTAAIPKVERRDLVMVALLATVTLTVYCFYLLYQWAKEITQLTGKERNPSTVVLISVLTLGIGAIVYEYLFALEAAEYRQKRFPKELPSSLPTWVLVLNSLTVLCSLTFFLAPLAIIFGIAASVLVQAQFNRLADE